MINENIWQDIQLSPGLWCIYYECKDFIIKSCYTLNFKNDRLRAIKDFWRHYERLTANIAITKDW